MTGKDKRKSSGGKPLLPKGYCEQRKKLEMLLCKVLIENTEKEKAK